MPTCSTTFDFGDSLDNVFSDFFPRVNRHIQLNILLRKWEERQRRSKKYWNETFNHDGFLSEDVNNNVLYIINDKRNFMKRVHEMQRYIVKNAISPLTNSNVAYMFVDKTNSQIVNKNEYSKKYRDFILQEINVIRPILIVVCDGNYDILYNMIHDKRNEELTKGIKYIPIINMQPLEMKTTPKKEYLLYFKYLYDRKFFIRG